MLDRDAGENVTAADAAPVADTDSATLGVRVIDVDGTGDGELDAAIEFNSLVVGAIVAVAVNVLLRVIVAVND